MNITIIGNNSDGIYRFRKDLIKKIVQLNHKVSILTPFDFCIEELNQLKINLIETKLNRRSMNPFSDLILIFKYFTFLKSNNPDLVITYTIKPNIYSGLVCRLLRIQYVANITGLGTTFQNKGFVKRVVIFLYRISLKKAKVVFFENKENMDIFIDNHIIRKEQAKLLNGAGVNTHEYSYKTYPSIDEPVKFLFIGRVMKEKGIEELLYAAEKIKQEYNSVEFDIVGPMEDDYETIIKDFQQRDIIKYHGFQKDVRKFIEQCHCFVLPSYHEGMANTLLEAASMGRPLITTNIHGCKESIHNNGYIVSVQNKNALYEKIKKFIHLSYEEKIQMGINSRKHMESVFDKQKVVENTIKELDL